MARSNSLRIFGVETLDELTGEQYNVLVESEILHAEVQNKALKNMKTRNVRGGKQGQTKGQTFTIGTKH